MGRLMILFANGDPEAARALTSRLLPRALGHAARVLGDRAEAEDVAQEAMMRLWKAAAGWRQDGGAEPATWLYRVVANICIDRLAPSGRTDPLDDADAARRLDTPGRRWRGMVQGRSGLAALDAAAGQFAGIRQRQAVVLRHYRGGFQPRDLGISGCGGGGRSEAWTARGKRELAEALPAGRRRWAMTGDETIRIGRAVARRARGGRARRRPWWRGAGPTPRWCSAAQARRRGEVRPPRRGSARRRCAGLVHGMGGWARSSRA